MLRPYLLLEEREICCFVRISPREPTPVTELRLEIILMLGGIFDELCHLHHVDYVTG
jgi:hypothetical protein